MGESETRDQVDSENVIDPLWMWFAIAAAILLIIEMILSRPIQSSPTSTNSIHA